MELKGETEPDNEVEQLAILLEGKNKSCARNVTGSVPKAVQNRICEICRLICETEKKYTNHNKSYKSDGDWNCEKCDFQTNSIQQASKEQQYKHICAGEKSETNPLKTVECTVCNDKFSNKTELNSHKLKTHKSWKLCIKFFSQDPNVHCQHKPCHLSHVQPSPDMHRCYNCGREFPSLEGLMLHRKSIHNTI